VDATPVTEGVDVPPAVAEKVRGGGRPRSASGSRFRKRMSRSRSGEGSGIE